MEKEQPRGVFSNREIHEAIKIGHIVCRPLVVQYVNGSSVDVTLGNYYYETDRNTDSGIYDPYDEDDVKAYFGNVKEAIPLNQQPGLDKLTDHLPKNIPEDHPVIMIGPGERILAHTHEFIGIRAPGTTSLQARSTTGRNGIAVCIDAGWGDPGYINRWTLEIMNLNKRHHVPLPVAERIAQMVFYHTGPVDGEYSSLSGKYQAEAADDLESLIRNWKPEHMLPRAYKDQRRRPLDI